jgi:hypothetical protein
MAGEYAEMASDCDLELVCESSFNMASTDVCSLSVGLFLSLMDTVVLSAALVTISEEFEDWRLAFWAIMAYSLAYAGTFTASEISLNQSN